MGANGRRAVDGLNDFDRRKFATRILGELGQVSRLRGQPVRDWTISFGIPSMARTTVLHVRHLAGALGLRRGRRYRGTEQNRYRDGTEQCPCNVTFMGSFSSADGQPAISVSCSGSVLQ